MSNALGTPGTNWLDDPAHRAWLSAHRESLLDFYQPQVVLEGAGHWVQQERPGEVSDFLLGFLSQL